MNMMVKLGYNKTTKMSRNSLSYIFLKKMHVINATDIKLMIVDSCRHQVIHIPARKIPMFNISKNRSMPMITCNLEMTGCKDWMVTALNCLENMQVKGCT